MLTRLTPAVQYLDQIRSRLFLDIVNPTPVPHSPVSRFVRSAESGGQSSGAANALHRGPRRHIPAPFGHGAHPLAAGDEGGEPYELSSSQGTLVQENEKKRKNLRRFISVFFFSCRLAVFFCGSYTRMCRALRKECDVNKKSLYPRG